MTTYYSYMDSPLGWLLLTAYGAALTRVTMTRQKYADPMQPDWQHNDTALHAARDQLQSYFDGERHDFDLPLQPAGTEFQRRVWSELRAIPFGHTVSYGTLAQRIGRVNASRAVGMANGRNPIPIIIPCHRVIGADGSLTGYGGGMERKRWLLAHEGWRARGATTGQQQTLF